MSVDEAATRRAARASWRGHVFHTWEEAEEFDVAFWLAIPVRDRARVTWELSREMWAIAHPDELHEPRLSRSIASITRR
jgi:hypothetical protein